MKNAGRKPPAIASISGQFSPDTITQEELRKLGDLQAAEWLAAKNTHKAALIIENRLNLGAQIEPGELTFDRELGMMRRANGHRKTGTT
jgi:hypothetical protein